MKLSNNSIGMLIFIALATAVFVLMALRPAIDGNAMNLGVPMSTEMAASASTETSTESTMSEAAATEAATTETTSVETTTETPAPATEENLPAVSTEETSAPAIEENLPAVTTEEAPSVETTTESTTTD